ncbi:790_t:CDS:2, partial [Dentiscutata erythropus]
FGASLKTQIQSSKSASKVACQYFKIKKIYKNNSRISSSLLFGLTLTSVENIRRTLTLNYNYQIYPFEKLSVSTQHCKLLKVAQQVLNTVEKEKKNFHSNDYINIKQIRLEIGEEQFDINFGKFDKKSEEERKKAIVKSLNCGQITREAYRLLARIEYNIPREGAISEIRQKINLEMKKNFTITCKYIIANYI